MIAAAAYARRSTEQHVAEDARSVSRQLELGRDFAAERGWTIVAEYADDGISGALGTKLTDRARMLAAAADEKFSVLIVRDLDRLSRNDEELPSLIYTLRDAGVEVWCYADRKSVDTRTALTRGMLSMRATFAAAEREAAQSRTREAMRSKAQRGHVAGGVVYGYRNVRAGDHVERAIHTDQATIIRRIFSESAAGSGIARIAKGLNAEGVPSPARGRGWASTGVREILFRPLYRGRVVYGRTRWEYRGGRKFKVRVPESEWIVLERPELRIVGEDLWATAHARMDRTRELYRKSGRGALWGRPVATAGGHGVSYLLSGLLLCGVCGWGFHATHRTSRRGEAKRYYICTAHRTRGDVVCGNAWSAPMEELHHDVVTALKRDVLDPEWVRDVLKQTLELRAARPAAVAERRKAILAELERLEAELRRYAEAIGAGEPLPAILEAMRTRERRRQAAQAELSALPVAERRAPAVAAPDVYRRLSSQLTDWQGLLDRHPARARDEVIRPLLTGRLVLTPRLIDEGRWFEFSGDASYGALIRGLVGGVNGMVPPG
jgi:site-specific DNA recombinase